MLRPGVIRPLAASAGAALALALALPACGGDGDDAPSPAPRQERPVAVRGVTSAACSDVHRSGSRRPDRIIVSTVPLQGGLRAEALQMSQAIDLVLEQRRFRAGRFAVGYQVCDDSVAKGGLSDPERCAANGRAFARTPSVIGVVGPFLSVCAATLLPEINRDTNGELGVISPATSYIGLTRGGVGVAPGDPDRYYPAKRRNFVRVAVADHIQGAANALMAQRLGLRRVYVLDDGSLYGEGVATTFRRTARALGLGVAGDRTWDEKDARYLGLAGDIRRSGADGVFLGGVLFANGGRLIKDLRARLAAEVKLMAPDGFGPPSAVVQRAGTAAEGMTISKPDIPRHTLGARGRRFHDAMSARVGKGPCCHTMYGAQAAEVLLDAIAASDGTRRSVTAQLFRSRVRDGLLGSFGFDRNGDTTLRRIFIHRISRGELRFVTTITPPARLTAR